MLCCAVLWSLSGVLIKYVSWHPLVISGWRSLLAAGVMALYMKHSRIPIRFTRKNVPGALSILLMCSTYICANKLTSPSNAIILQFTTPLFILIISSILWKVRFSFIDAAAVILTMLGVGIVFFQSIDREHMLGDFIAVASGFFASGMYLSVGRSCISERAITILLGHLLCSAAGVPLTLFFQTTADPSSLLAILALGLIQLGIPYILLLLAAERCPPLACSLLSAVEPLLSPVWVFLAMGEAPGRRTVIGGALIITTVTLWNIYSAKKNTKVNHT